MQVLSQMGPALQPAAAAPDGLLTGVAAEYGLPVLTGIVELYAAIEALQVRVLRNTWWLVSPMRSSNCAAYQPASGC